MIVTVSTKGKKIRPVRHQGIVKTARYLGVTRQHLYMVIRGERRSPRIERYLAEHMVKGEEGR